jgi:hypothetical protein
MSKPPVEVAFKAYWADAQPLFAIRDKTGKSISDPDHAREIQRQIEQAYKAAWRDCGDQVLALITK